MKKVKCNYCGKENPYPKTDKPTEKNTCECGYVLFKSWYDFWRGI